MKLGTFLGVYTPSVLTILGVVLFLRTGWMVGNVGLLPALAIVLLAHLITIATALSVSAIATNMRVGGGGAYYLISRSLGLEIGGAIGVPLFLAQTFSVTLYAFGFAEGVQMIWPEAPGTWIAAGVVVLVAALSAYSADLALKLQLPIMVALGLALALLVAGSLRDPVANVPLLAASEDSVGFWIVFAVFFPAVTGLLSGVSMSGDLENPKRSIPVGTMAAVFTGLVVYLLVPVALSLGAPADELRQDNLVWFRVALVPMLLWPGFFGAIVSSAIGSILGAPRTLEALAGDRVIPRLPRWHLFGRKVDVALLLSTVVALAAVALGDLNAVAPVLTMFFLTTYGVINLAAGLEEISGSPSYRPSIRVPWWISLAGAAGSLWVMMLINAGATVVAVLIEIGLYMALRRRSFSTAFGDLRYGALVSLARASLVRLRTLPMDPRNWRPHILAFAGDPEKRIDLIRIAAWLNQNRGILTICRLFEGRFDELAPTLQEKVQETNALLDREGIIAFAEAEIVENLETGILDVCQANGIAGLTSNTLMLGWSADRNRMISFMRVVRRASTLEKSTVLCKITPRRWSSRLERIDVWWGGLQNNGDMLLLYAYLIGANPEWADATITVKTIASSSLTLDATQTSLAALLERSRIRARSEVVEREGQTIHEIIQGHSQGADLVLMGLQAPAAGDEERVLERLERLVGDLPTVLMVHAAGPYAGSLLK